MIALNNRIHLFDRPNSKERLIHFVTTILDCPVSRFDVPGIPAAIIAFRLPNGGSLSVEFTDDAMDEERVQLGAWLELVADDPEQLKQRVIDAGLPLVHHAGQEHFYFKAPGGQVFGIAGTR